MRQAILIIALSAGACSPYHLATNGTSPPDANFAQMRTDASTCAQQARDQSPAPAVAFAFGLTADQSASQKARARRTYADCLQQRGWSNITPATD